MFKKVFDTVFNTLLYYIFGTIRPKLYYSQPYPYQPPYFGIKYKRGWGSKGVVLAMDIVTVILLADIMVTILEKDPALKNSTDSKGMVLINALDKEIPVPKEFFNYILDIIRPIIPSAYALIKESDIGREKWLLHEKEKGVPEDKLAQLAKDNPSASDMLLKALGKQNNIDIPDNRVLH